MKDMTGKITLNPGSRIFWRIAGVIFLSILLIEAVLLVFSWFAERNRKIGAVEESLAAIVSLLDHVNPSVQLDALRDSPDKATNIVLTGYLHISSDGSVNAGGDIIGLQQYSNAQNPVQFNMRSGILTSYLESEDGNDQYWLRTDASWILDYMRSYVLRIFGMVMAVSLFVTVACLVFLKPLLLNSLHRLDQLLIQGKKKGIKFAAPIKKDLSRNDELGSVFQSFAMLRNRLLESEQENITITDRFEMFASMGADCFWETDPQHTVTYIAGDVARVLSLSIEDVIGKRYTDIFVDTRSRSKDALSLSQSLENHGLWEGDIVTIGNNSSPVSVRIVSQPLISASGGLTGFRGTITDICNEIALTQKLEHQATHDELTGLANRRELTSQIQQAITECKKAECGVSLLIIDLDRFKTVNDSCGHSAGDLLIKSLAKIMNDTVLEADTVARIGGDEFAVLLRARSLQESQEVGERIRYLIEGYSFYWNEQVYKVSASIGIAQLSDMLDSQEALMFAADSCCLKAKQQGKNQVQIYSQEDTSSNLFRDEAIWISRILQALEGDGFSLFRQSIIPLGLKNEEEHFEVLLRMKDPHGGFWPPVLFLGVAERNDLMSKIDQWVVNAALAWLARQHLPQDGGFCMNINLSAASLSDTNFRQFLFDRVKQNVDLNRYVCFEITETAAMVNLEETISLLSQLKDLGCQVALDDFGTGFSSLSHIKDMPLDYIKIDGVFIQNIIESKLDQTVVESVARIARVLDIKTVAEFVETESTLRVLESIDIDYAQGYLFSKPEKLDMGENNFYMPKAA